MPGIIGCENKALTTPLLFDPGERWDYGINIDWAGKMVEAASGQKLGQYLQGQLLGPLGMDSTAFFITPGMRERLAQDPSARRRRRADARHGARDPAGARVRDGRRRALRHGRRLPEVRAHDAEPGQVRPRRAGAEARDRGADVEERHGRLQGLPAQDGDAAALQRRRVLPRHRQEVGPLLHDQQRRRRRPAARPAAWPGRASPTPTTGSTRRRASAASTPPRSCRSPTSRRCRCSTPSRRRSTS